jgi:gamma-glutamyltranspeptidase/glutathione hydrolase
MDVRSRAEWRKSEAVAANGMITCLHPLAAEAAVGVLRGGGNAVDAAVTAAFVLGVVEPMMSGVGGGGVLVARLADGQTVVVDHSPAAPAAARPEAFPLAGSGTATFYAWPAVEGDLNMIGPRSIATPSTVAGLALALERYGTLSLAEALGPAIRFAEEGFPVDLFTGAAIADDMRNLSRFPGTAAIFLPDGFPPRTDAAGVSDVVVQADLGRTLREIAADGAETFYRGELARRLTTKLGDGALLTAADLAAYRPRVYEGDETLIGHYRGLEIHGAPFEGGAVTTAALLGLLDRHDLGAVGAGSGLAYHLVAEAARRAFADRFAYLADHEQVDVPWAALRDPVYLDRRAAEIDPARATIEAGPGLGEAPRGDGHTTHLTVVDRDRNAVALTQTIVDSFGSRVVAPGTGVVLNDGMMWFDPRPGRANSVAGGKRALTAMSPLILCRDGEPVMAIGGSGGRKIITAVAQVISNVVDHGLGPQAAVEVPRVHCEGAATLVDDRARREARAALERRGHRLTLFTETPVSVHFALPNAIVIGEDGLLRGGVDQFRPGTAAGY